MKCIQYTVIFLFGFILVLAIFALALYVADEDSQSLDGEFIEVADYICGALSLFVIGSSFVGCWITYNLGTLDIKVDELRNRVYRLERDKGEFGALRQLLQREAR